VEQIRYFGTTVTNQNLIQEEIKRKLNSANACYHSVQNRLSSRLLHNEELHNLCSSPSIIRVIKSRRMRCAGHAARMGERRNAYRIFVGKPDGKTKTEMGGQY
jgi:hypothetical protein